MARKDKPYLPLYVQDFLTDEQLNECSASATGVFIKMMCVMHKSSEYGTILLKQKDKQMYEQLLKQNNNQELQQIDKQVFYFASKIAKQISFSVEIIAAAILELLDEKVLKISGDKLYQKRMVDDGMLSIKRSKSGSSGGKKTQKKNKESRKNDDEFAKANNEANALPKDEANADIDIDNNIISILNSKKEEGEEFNKYPNEKNCDLELPENYIKKSIEYLDRNKQISKSEGQIVVIWEMFKLENFTGKKFYDNEKEIFTHFLRTLKNEKNGTAYQHSNKANKVSSEPSFDRP